MKIRIVMTIVFSAVLLIGCGNSTDDNNSTEDIESAPISSSTQTVNEYKPITTSVTLDLLNYQSYIDYASYISFPSGNKYKGNFLHIVGEFYNPSTSNVKLSDDKIEATFYNAEGLVLEVDSILKHEYFKDETITPGGKWSFMVILLDEDASQKVADYKLSAKGKQMTDEIPQLEIVSYKLFPNENFPDKYNDLIAEIVNTTNSNIEVTFIAKFYDKEGIVIDADNFFISATLAPGEKAPAGLSPVPIEARRCELVARYKISKNLSYREFETYNIVYQEGPKWKWDSIIGEVKNIGKQTIDNVYLYASFYDDNGILLDYQVSVIEPNTLGPDEIGIFDLIAPSPPWEMPNYCLLVYTLP